MNLIACGISQIYPKRYAGDVAENFEWNYCRRHRRCAARLEFFSPDLIQKREIFRDKSDRSVKCTLELCEQVLHNVVDLGVEYFLLMRYHPLRKRHTKVWLTNFVCWLLLWKQSVITAPTNEVNVRPRAWRESRMEGVVAGGLAAAPLVWKFLDRLFCKKWNFFNWGKQLRSV